MARKNRRTIVSLVAVLGVALGGWMVLSAGGSEAVDTEELFSPMQKGKGKPGGGCCDPSLEPGVGGNPLCFEGHSCCASGAWQCNNADGSPSCSLGMPCNAECVSVGDACSDDADCCSNRCKGGRCKS